MSNNNSNWESVIDICEYSVILVLILIIIWLSHTVTAKNNDNGKLEWINQGHPSGKFGKFNPAKRFNDISSKYGKPDIIDKSRGGSAVWKTTTLEKRGFCWDRIEIRDEQVPHSHPAPHVDFLYYWYKLYVPENKINDIREISESVTYDPLKKLLGVRCHFEGANVATMVCAKRVATGEFTLDEAKKSYGPLIFSTIKEHEMHNPEALSTMITELCDHKKTQVWAI
jgi:hypothetical protein